MNGNYKVEWLLDDHYDFIGSIDCVGFNAGSFLIRNNQWSREYLDKVMAIKFPQPAEFKEQSALMNVMVRDQLESHFKWISQRAINSYPSTSCQQHSFMSHYKPGDFVLHFAGQSKQSGFEHVIEYYASQSSGLENVHLP